MGNGGIQLVVNVDPGSEAVSGDITAADGEVRRFTGYAELIATIEGLRVAASHQHPRAEVAP